MSAAGRTQGFTLVELMITMALLAIMAMIAVPSFTQFTINNRLQAKAEELKSFLQAARTEAVVKRAVITLKAKDADKWIAVRPSKDSNASIRTLEINPTEAKLAAANASGSAVNELTYYANGVVKAPVNFTICHDKKTESGYQVSVAANGSIHLAPRGKQKDNAALAKCE
ncbi:GspH/FimT family pseudopilin [uncultured Pseudomonas sp.]|uniref:GspH/FimT family pseudopilin n=1 Tax=uncultured Pseudomonas sp. TaxID=114707 RepID=UPI00260A537E|nr:GspH/FimT family pseudopilin [uncultured Pseudomonas sp.]